MILLIAGDYEEARRWAYSQQLDDDEWKYPNDESDIRKMSNFHVLVVGTAGQNVPSSYFERVLNLAKTRGRINRGT